MRPYPKLMVLGEAPDDLVVFFSNETQGIVVHSTGDPYVAFGSLLLDSDPSEYEDVDEETIIWLTEGPSDIIYEAIEVIDKIRMLPDHSSDIQHLANDSDLPSVEE